MGRKQIYKPAILKTLNESKNPIRFSEIKKQVMHILKRKKIDDKQISINLKYLLEVGLIKKVLFKNKLSYKLSEGYYEQEMKNSVVRIFSDMNMNHMYDSLDSQELPPHIVFLNPPAYDYENKIPIEELDRYEMNLSYGGGPMKKIGDFRIEPTWDVPHKAISSIMFNDYNGLFTREEKNNINKLIQWSYWTGVRDKIDDDSIINLKELIKNNIEHSKECVIKFKDNSKRVEAEYALINILEMTEKLFEINNLKDFISHLYNNKDEYNRLYNRILLLEGIMAGGERIFNNFFEHGRMVVYGLYTAGLLKNESNKYSDYQIQYFMSSTKVWDDFFTEILLGPTYIPEYDYPELLEISGSLPESIAKLIEYEKYLKNLLELPFKRKITLVYLWGFPETTSLSEKGIIRYFEDWRKALNNGNLTHRTWIFEEKTLDQLRKAYHAVRRDKVPPPLKIDLELWTLQDVYYHHPLGSNPDFWDQLIREIEAWK